MANIIELKNKDGKVYFRLNKGNNSGVYSIFDFSGQAKYCDSIKVVGFEKLPSGFYTNNGVGLTGVGNYFFSVLSEIFNKKVDLTITSTGKSKFDARGKKLIIRLNHKDLLNINKKVRNIKTVKNEDIRIEVKRFFAVIFQNKAFKKFKKTKPQYSSGELSEVLNKENLFLRMNSDDKQNLEHFIPDYLSKVKVNLKGKEKLKVIFDSIDASKKVYFKKILAEFKRKLKQKNQKEGVWQEFLSNYILILKNTYGEVLEKESVSLQGKFPDFMIIDPYGYLDIYEIKKPYTKLLGYDKNRNNYYWDTEISKAISQVENYLHQVMKNSDGLIVDIKNNKGIDINIVRPRGYIIAGLRTELTKPKMEDDIRILNESLKNIDIIFYDDLLNNLEAFIQRIK